MNLSSIELEDNPNVSYLLTEECTFNTVTLSFNIGTERINTTAGIDWKSAVFAGILEVKDTKIHNVCIFNIMHVCYTLLFIHARAKIIILLCSCQ